MKQAGVFAMVLALLAATPVWGQALTQAQKDETREDAEKTVKKQQATYIVPETPAFTFLGITPTTVTRPTTPRDLVTSLLDGFDAEGRVVRGFALEMTPSYVFGLDPGGSWLREALANSGVSLGTVQSAGDTSATDFAVGWRINLYDAGNPMRARKFQDAVVGILGLGRPDVPNAVVDTARIDAALDSLHVAWSKQHWNASRLAAGVGSGSRLLNSEFANNHYLGVSAWLAGGYGIGSHAQLLAQVQYDQRAAVSSVPDSSRWTFGGRGVVGSPSFNGYVEVVGHAAASGGYVHSQPTHATWTAGLEVLLVDSLWLSAGVGDAGNPSGGPDRAVVLANVRWVFSSKPRLSPTGS